jgi:hypothetical protein
MRKIGEQDMVVSGHTLHFDYGARSDIKLPPRRVGILILFSAQL